MRDEVNKKTVSYAGGASLICACQVEEKNMNEHAWYCLLNIILKGFQKNNFTSQSIHNIHLKKQIITLELPQRFLLETRST